MRSFGKEKTMTAATAGRRRLALALASVCVALAATLAASVSAQAEFGIAPDSFAVTTSTAQAGAHPDVNVRFTLNNDGGYPPVTDGTVKTVVVDLPAGLLGDPTKAPRCAIAAFPDCPLETQVGTIRLRTGLLPEVSAPVYNIVPSNGSPAEFAFNAYLLPVRIQVAVRTEGDHGLRTTIETLPTLAPMSETDLTFWGVPADPSHRAMRGYECADLGGFEDCRGDGDRDSTDARKPFMSNTTVCGPQAPARLAVESWERPGRWDRAAASLPAITGCDALSFDAAATVRADEPKAGAPSGYSVELSVAQSTDPDGLATPPLKQAVVTLPAGTVVAPPVADGLRTCSEAQFNYGTRDDVSCPQASDVGDVSIDSPLLDVPLTGDVYLVDQAPQQLLRIVLVAEARGVRLKLPGRIDLDPVTGRVTAVFDQNPQLPFSALRMTLKGGPRAVLSNPRQCGPATSTAVLTPYGGGAAVNATDSFDVSGDGAGAPCPPAKFAPRFSAGSASAAAGQSSPFTLTFGRDDADEPLGAIDVSLPAGVMPKIGTVPVCAEAQAAAGTCGEESRVGSVVATAGAGSQPYTLPGRVYVAGAYKGAPYSLLIVVPAQAGPFDLGTVVIRAAAHVDLHSAALRLVSDAIPTIVQGIPLQLRSVRIVVDKPGFVVNPTSCAARQVGATIAAATGATAQAAVRYQAADCARLPFAPKLSVKVGGKGQVGAGRPTSLTATMTQAAGQAAARSVRLELPRSLNARLAIVRRACTGEAYDAGNCGEKARIGTGSAVTSLLSRPLSGSAYFVRRTTGLPDLVVQLRGEVSIDLVGKVEITRSQQLVTTFQGIPDVPLSKFALKLPAKTSPVASVAGLCTKAGRNALSRQVMRGQNGKLVQRKAKLSIAGCAKAKKK
jgi:hypothetical protein